MKVNLDAPLLSLDGTEVKDADGKTTATLKASIVNALLAVNEASHKQPGTEKLAKFKLAEKINKGGEITLSSDEVVKIKESVSSSYGPLVVGRVFTVIDPDGK